MRTIAHISDIHFGTISDTRIVDALVAEINARRPSLVVCSGDLTQRARAGQYRAAAELLARFDSPRLVVPGNHDIPLFDVFRRFIAPLSNFRKHITPDLQPVFADEEMVVVGINSARSFSFSLNGFWKDGRISQAQLDQTKRLLGDANDGRIKIVVTHHPFIPPPKARVHGIVHGAARALETLESCGVHLLLAGHLHQAYSGDVQTHHQATRRSILSIQAGTATSGRQRGEPNAYNWITLNAGRIDVEVRVWDGSEFVSRFT